ncbi:winged helix-turn-helix transcriptional regulator [Enterococcus nangangensis]|uniref:winged helix-turn-helix transcriptional regulator n=1 Tax=Enterococcus nangangensis TaxID=2559926 RepID=UPI0010F5BF32|nr:helix-turn-helix domain-containing protein [Enterococcus nangangensis]
MEMMAMDYHLCPKFQKTFTVLGKKWNGLILDVLLEGGAQRFSQLAEKIPAVSDRVLVERLKELEVEGLVTRKSLGPDSLRMEYCLTEKGQDLRTALLALRRWSENWIELTPAEMTEG